MPLKRRSSGARRHKREEADIEYMASLCKEQPTPQPTTACEEDEAGVFAEAYQSFSASEGERQMQQKLATEESMLQAGQGEQQQNAQQEITNGGALAEKEEEAERDGGSQELMKEKEDAGEAEGEEADESKDRKEGEEEKETKDEEEPFDGEGQSENGLVKQHKQQQEEQQQQQEEEEGQQEEGGEVQLQEEDEQQQQTEEEPQDQQEDVQRMDQPTEPLHLSAAGIAAGAAPRKEDGADDDGTVAEETDSARRPEDAAFRACWGSPADAEFRVAPPSVGSANVSYVTGLATSVCEEARIFVSGNGPYGPLGRSRVFNEAMHVVGNRIPAATARYLRQAETESVPDACLSCAEDVSQSCFPATRLLMDTILASGAAVCSLAYNYRKEILEGMHVISDTALKCFRTCVCTLMPPPQEPRRVRRPPPAPWTSVGTFTEVWNADTANMNPQQRRERRLASMQTASLPCYVSRAEGEQQVPQTPVRYLHPLGSLNSVRSVFSKRIPGNC